MRGLSDYFRSIHRGVQFFAATILAMLLVHCSPHGNFRMRTSMSGQGFSFSELAPAASATNGLSALDLRIFGGTVVAQNDDIAAHTVLLQVGDGLCSAVIVSDRSLLTAAHCLAYLKDKSQIKIYFGADLTQTAQDIYDGTKVASFEAHPSFTGRAISYKTSRYLLVYDIGYIKLNTPIPTNLGFSPANLERNTFTVTRGASLVVAGYGINDLTKKTVDGLLRKTSTVFSRYLYYYDRPLQTYLAIIQDNEIQSGSCHGDSGGPLFKTVNGTNYLVGLVSSGAPNCQGEADYTSVPEYLGWLKQKGVIL